jgi:aryl-phospho-beta-D-glucosidase BglC (GH1 family)
MKNKLVLTLYCLVGPLMIQQTHAQITPYDAVKHMARGINIGNTMEAPDEGLWNSPVQEVYFDDYKNAGFTSVRIPITWDEHTDRTSPYKINSTWMNRVEQVVDWGLARGLFIIINAHHDDSIKVHYTDAIERNRFDSMWSQISVRFKDKSDSLLFEIINEPKGLTQSQINELNVRELSIIRKTNPTRLVIFSGNEWANSDQLVAAATPDTGDHHLIGYYHSYDPYPFGLKGTGTYGSTADINATKAKFDQVTAWSVAHNIPVIISEFGANKAANYNSRMIYYATVAEQALNHGVAFNAWDDGGNFPIMLRSTNDWNDIKDILIYTYKESPTKLKAITTPDTILTLSWTNRTSENDSIEVDRKTDTSDFAPFAKLGHDAAQLTDPDVIIGNTYYYRLRTRLKDSIDLYSYPFKVTIAVTPVSIENIQLHNEPEIYPNPASNNITISLNNGETFARLDVFDLLGKQIKSSNIAGANTNIDISDLNKGLYFFKITSSNTIVTSRVMVE